MKKAIIILVAAFLSLGMQAQTAPQLTADNIGDVVKAMTLREKATILVGSHRESTTHWATYVKGAAGCTIAFPRLGITPLLLCDGPAGLRIAPTRPYDSRDFRCTWFPGGTLLAATWSPGAVGRVASALGNEVLEHGADLLLAPGMNIMRNPLGGRNFEYYSEDPVLSGLTAAAYINGVQSQGVGVIPKHFIMSNQEAQRYGNDARVGQRALRELYLRNFEVMLAKSSPWIVMSSYNRVNGVMTSESRDLLTTVLRDEWGYKGAVVSDWRGGFDPVWRGNKTDRVANIKAGNDLIMPGEEVDVNTIEEAVKSGKLSEEDVDRSVARVLGVVVKSPRYKGYKYSNAPDLQAHAAVVRKEAAEGTVLLSNNGVLPLASDVRKVALFGVASYAPQPGGKGSGRVNSRYTVSLVEGMRKSGYVVDSSLLGFYDDYISRAVTDTALQYTGCNKSTVPREPVVGAGEIARTAADDDVAVITLQRLSSEGGDRLASDFCLRDGEERLLADVAAAFHKAGKRVVVVMNVCGPMETTSWRDSVDAILLPWLPGQEFGFTVADLLSGKSFPSGKLPMTWPKALADVPSTANFPLEGRGTLTDKAHPELQGVSTLGYTNYEEGIYVGYRYFDSFNREVAYPFGFGLSYTSFGYGGLRVSADGDSIVVSVTVTNEGLRDGKEVAQLYVSAPKGAVEKPAQELKAFAKTHTLKPGESETLTMRVGKRWLASFVEKKSAWVSDAGVYTFRIGSSSRDIRLKAALRLPRYTEKVHNVLAPAEPIKMNAVK